MHRFMISVSAAALMVAGLCWVSRSVSAAPKGIVGTWEIVSAEVNGQPDTGKSVKMISAHRFMFVEYDPKTMKIMNAGCGTYTLNGDSYVEHIEFIDAVGQEMPNFIGTDVKFTMKVNGDTFTQEGKLGDLNIKETYKRLE